MDKSLEDHKAWADNVQRRLDNIYKSLCEFEQMRSDEDDISNILELLFCIDDTHAAAQSLHIESNLLKAKKDDLREQMELLQRSVDLLQLEKKSTNTE